MEEIVNNVVYNLPPKKDKKITRIIPFVFILTIIIIFVLCFFIKTSKNNVNKKINVLPKSIEEILFKQYVNSKYGFKIDYPVSWADPVVYPQEQRTEFHFNNDDFIIFVGKIWRQEKAKLISYEEYIEEFKTLSKEEGKSVTIKDFQGFKFSNPIKMDNKKGFNLIFPTKTKNIILEIYFRGEVQNIELFRIYNRMVSSFEFIK